MTWQSLPPITLNKDGAYVPLPLAGAGGRVPLQIPPFAIGEEGRYEIGIYDLPPGGPPGLVAPAQDALIARYTRNLIFEVPPSIAAPHVGLRLLSHADLDNKSYSLALKWQEPYGAGGGTSPPNAVGGLIMQASWSEVRAYLQEGIRAGLVTWEELISEIGDVQEAIEALGLSAATNQALSGIEGRVQLLESNSATQQALLAIASRIDLLESADPVQAQAIQDLQQAFSDLISGNATDAELAAAIATIQTQLEGLASDSELSGAIVPLQAAIDGLNGTYATDAELAAAIANLVTQNDFESSFFNLLSAIAAEQTARQQAIAPLATQDALTQAIAPLATQDALTQAIAPLATQDALTQAIAPLATQDALTQAIAPLATQDALTQAIAAEQTARAQAIASIQNPYNYVGPFSGLPATIPEGFRWLETPGMLPWERGGGEWLEESTQAYGLSISVTFSANNSGNYLGNMALPIPSKLFLVDMRIAVVNYSGTIPAGAVTGLLAFRNSLNLSVNSSLAGVPTPTEVAANTPIIWSIASNVAIDPDTTVDGRRLVTFDARIANTPAIRCTYAQVQYRRIR